MPDHSYTLAEAAAALGLREEVLTPMLPGIGVDLTSRSPQTLTAAEFGQIADEQRRIAILRTQEGGEFRRSGVDDDTLAPGDVQ